jgi:hypothetical protein
MKTIEKDIMTLNNHNNSQQQQVDDVDVFQKFSKMSTFVNICQQTSTSRHKKHRFLATCLPSGRQLATTVNINADTVNISVNLSDNRQA